MELTTDQIEQEIAKLEAEREQFAQKANMQIAAYNGALQVWQQLLAKAVPQQPETARDDEAPQALGVEQR